MLSHSLFFFFETPVMHMLDFGLCSLTSGASSVLSVVSYLPCPPSNLFFSENNFLGVSYLMPKFCQFSSPFFPEFLYFWCFHLFFFITHFMHQVFKFYDGKFGYSVYILSFLHLWGSFFSPWEYFIFVSVWMVSVPIQYLLILLLVHYVGWISGPTIYRKLLCAYVGEGCKMRREKSIWWISKLCNSRASSSVHKAVDHFPQIWHLLAAILAVPPCT